MVQAVIAGICFLIALLFFLTEIVGLYKFSYLFNRVHITSLGDSFGIGFILIGVLVLYGLTPVSLKVLLVGLFMMLSGPALSHLIGEMEFLHNEQEGDDSHYRKEDRL